MTCRRICKKYKVTRLHSFGSRYANGQVRCSVCEVFLKDSDCKIYGRLGLYCPCCKIKVRTKPRTTILNERQRLKKI